jgi:hypothetical protein
VILVVTEGKVTEPSYLNGFRDWVHNPRVQIRMVPGAGSPGSIVNEAVTRKRSAEQLARRERDRNHAFDEVWCVFDVDEHKDMDCAEELAKQNGLSLAISNPCFELWLLLHFREQPGMQSCQSLQTMLEEHINGYDKKVDFVKQFSERYEIALGRARLLDENALHDGEPRRNPSTGVWRLTESIRR